MGSLTDREIIKASDAIDKALASINKNNRGEVSVRILSLVRNLNDNIAEKIWCDIHPEKPCSVNKVGKEFINEPSYRFIGRFYNYLGKSVSHFTPTEDGAERLMLKYYQYVLQLKEVMKSRYTYQIEAIGFGNWFNICRAVIPERCISELKTAYRTSDLELKKLWDDVRKMNEDNVVLEETVRNDYSHVIDEDIFQKRAEDEIILCLNYNGLYGLNNINKLLQLNNPNPTVTLGIWQFKIGDPILFNDSGRFELLYNNLKGIIVDIRENEAYIYFKIQVDAYFTKTEIQHEHELDYIKHINQKTIIGFKVYRTKPFESDGDFAENRHILPFQVAYAVSIHKAQGLEYDSVKIVIADETEEKITHNIFYTAITRARKELMIYWSPEVCNRILKRIRPSDYNKDYFLLKAKNNL